MYVTSPKGVLAVHKFLSFDDVLLIPKYNEINSRKDVDISVNLDDKVALKIPIFSSNMDTITEHEMAKYMFDKGGRGVLHRFMSIEKNVDEYKKSPALTFVSVGTTDKEYERFLALSEEGAFNFCVDVAHGHSKSTGEMIKKMKKEDPNCIIMAGNVATGEGVRYLKDCGADLVKVGIGGGSVCSTRIKTGFGVPTFHSIVECSHQGVPIIADGGIRTSGDIAKALAAGASAVMLGSMFAGSCYTPGKPTAFRKEPDYYLMSDGKMEPYKGGLIFSYYTAEMPQLVCKSVPTQKTYRGMASKEVADEHLGGLSEWKTAEGVSTTVPYKDEKETDAIIHDIIGGLRSALTYNGSSTIKNFQDTAEFCEITTAGRIESLPHKTLE
jgi:IMP dehydrogenase